MTLAQAKAELKAAWVKGEGYDQDETFIACYEDGECRSTRDTDERLPLKGIIGIQFCGSEEHYEVGYEMFKGEKIKIEG